MLSPYDVFRANFERTLAAFRRANTELRQDLEIALAADGQRREHDALKDRTDELQQEHDALDSPPTTSESTAEHAEHRARVRTHQEDLAEHRKRES